MIKKNKSDLEKKGLLNVEEILDDYNLNKDRDGWPFREHKLP